MKHMKVFYCILLPFTILFALEPAKANLEPEAIVEFTELVMDDELVKKFYIFQGGPVKKIRADPKRKHRKYHKFILKERLKQEK